MILEELGVLSAAQDLTNGSVDSTNVIDLGAIANVGFGDMWLSVITETIMGAAAGTSSTFTIALVVATESTLDNRKTILSIPIVNDVADPRIAAVDRNIACCEVGQMIADVADTTYRYMGLYMTLADGNGTATLSVNAAMSPSKPRTRDNVQVVRSNVGVPT